MPDVAPVIIAGDFNDWRLKADAVLVNKLKSLPNVTIHTNAQTTEITGADGKVNGLKYKDRATGEARSVPVAEAVDAVVAEVRDGR